MSQHHRRQAPAVMMLNTGAHRVVADNCL